MEIGENQGVGAECGPPTPAPQCCRAADGAKHHEGSTYVTTQDHGRRPPLDTVSSHCQVRAGRSWPDDQSSEENCPMSFQTRTQSCPINQQRKELSSHIKERWGARELCYSRRCGLRPHAPSSAPSLSCPAPAEHQPFGSSSLPIKDSNMDFPSSKWPSPHSTH